MRIDCDECVMQHTDACADCIVTYLLDPPPVRFDGDEEQAIRVLQDGGLAPRSRFVAVS